MYKIVVDKILIFSNLRINKPLLIVNSNNMLFARQSEGQSGSWNCHWCRLSLVYLRGNLNTYHHELFIQILPKNEVRPVGTGLPQSLWNCKMAWRRSAWWMGRHHPHGLQQPRLYRRLRCGSRKLVQPQPSLELTLARKFCHSFVKPPCYLCETINQSINQT